MCSVFNIQNNGTYRSRLSPRNTRQQHLLLPRACLRNATGYCLPSAHLKACTIQGSTNSISTNIYSSFCITNGDVIWLFATVPGSQVHIAIAPSHTHTHYGSGSRSRRSVLRDTMHKNITHATKYVDPGCPRLTRVVCVYAYVCVHAHMHTRNLMHIGGQEYNVSPQRVYRKYPLRCLLLTIWLNKVHVE